MKECTQEALLYYIGEDMGGKGGYLVAKDKVDTIDFIYVRGREKGQVYRQPKNGQSILVFQQNME
ncbi:MAG: hypothetical protein ACOX3Q_12605 [Clostridia bacterium]